MRTPVLLLLALTLAGAASAANQAPTIVYSCPVAVSERANLPGEVRVKIAISESGYVTSVEVLESTDRALNEACERAVLTWQFTPKVVNGRAVSCHVILPVRLKPE